MSLEHVDFVDLPPHVNDGGFDHAAVHEASGRIYVAHTANDAIDVIDIDARKYCDAGVLLEVDADRGHILATEAIAGVPDVVFFNSALSRLYVAIAEPAVIEVFDTVPLRRHETVRTEAGAHTLSFDASRNIVCAFLPASHRAAVYRDRA